MPILVMVLYSLNQVTPGLQQVTFNWKGFTLAVVPGVERLPGLTQRVVEVAPAGRLSTVLAILLGTLMALAMVRYRRGSGVKGSSSRMFMKIAAPEIVMGSSLLGCS